LKESLSEAGVELSRLCGAASVRR